MQFTLRREGVEIVTVGYLDTDEAGKSFVRRGVDSISIVDIITLSILIGILVETLRVLTLRGITVIRRTNSLVNVIGVIREIIRFISS